MDRHDPRLYGRSFAPVYDEWYGDLGDVDGIVRALRSRFPPGATIVELGSGTGRIVAPLHHAGFIVIGLDVSAEMLARAPTSSARIVADMAVVPLRDRSADAAVIAYNTIFNLAGPQHQRQCLAEASRLLAPGGLLAVDCFLSAPDSRGVEFSVREHDVAADGLVAILTSWVDGSPGRGSIIGTHLELRPGGVFSRPWSLSYLSPGRLDELATTAGLALVERAADWEGSPFVPSGDRHVSWYSPATGTRRRVRHEALR